MSSVHLTISGVDHWPGEPCWCGGQIHLTGTYEGSRAVVIIEASVLAEVVAYVRRQIEAGKGSPPASPT